MGLALGQAGFGLGVAGAGLAGVTTAAQYNMQAQQAAYQQQVALNNAAMLGPQITAAAQATEYAGIQQGLKARQEIGATTARFGAAGVKTNVPGSAVDVQKSQKMIGMMNEQAAVAAGAERTYGLEVQRTGYQAQAGLYGYESQMAQAMMIPAAAGATIGGLSKTFLSAGTAGLG